ncbi:Vacuolar protein sorting-associated protein 53 -like protein [Trichinella sp. T9]|nr:Vacuolar protein sorting-associated protein 53 -like protein [Trichinella sp. T9]
MFVLALRRLVVDLRWFRRFEIEKQFTGRLLKFCSTSTGMDQVLRMDSKSKALYQTIHSYIVHNDIVSNDDWYCFRRMLLESLDKQNTVDCAVFKVLEENCYFELGVSYISYLFDTGLDNPVTIKQAVHLLEQCFLKDFEHFHSGVAIQLLEHILVMEKSFPNFFTYQKAIVLCMCGHFRQCLSMWSSVLDCPTKRRLISTLFIAACRYSNTASIWSMRMKSPYTLSASCHMEMSKYLKEQLQKNGEWRSLRELDRYVIFYGESQSCTFDESAVEAFKKIKWSVDCGIVTDNGCCSCCSSPLKQLTLSDEDFNSMKDELVKRIVIGDSVYRQTSPEEYYRFRQFLNRNDPFDVVVDGCNVAYLGGPTSNDVYIRRITRLVRLLRFELKFRNILVIGRDHFMRFASDSLRTMAKLFSVSNETTDDAFVIVAAVISGKHCYMVSNDQLNTHCHKLYRPELDYFLLWRRMRQIFSEQAEPNAPRHRTLQIPKPLCSNVDRAYEDDRYHFLYVPTETNGVDDRHLRNVIERTEIEKRMMSGDSEEQKPKWLRVMDLQTPVRFSETVQSALDSVADPEDPFNKPDFCAISYINHLFPSEPSLGHVGQVMADVQRQIDQVDQEISDILEKQSVAQLDSEALLEQTKQAMRELFGRIMDIKRQTDMSETTVKEITRDIRQLDLAKKNLTASITTLNHLHMLVSGLESLESFVKTKNFRDISNLLPGIQNVLEHFSQYMTVPQIKALSDQVNSIRIELADLTTTEFKRYFSGGFKKASGQQQSVPIEDVCLVLSVLDRTVREGLISWLIDQQLAEYKILFDDTQDDAWLDKIDLRFSWFRDCLIEFERKHAALLPAEWDVACKFAAEFFHLTASMLDQVMEKRCVELDAKLVLFAVQRAANFEALMARRFPGRAQTLFQSVLVGRFQKRMSIYTASLDKTLTDLIDQLVAKFQQLGPPSAEYGTSAVPIPTSSDLFVFYKKSIQQLLQLGMNANILVDLSRLFKKYLHEYAQRCLTGLLPKIASAHTTTTAGLLQSFLKEGDMPRLSNDEIYLVCCILITAEFCAETSHQLQEKLKEKAGDLALHEAFDFTNEREMFHGVVSSCVQVLVQDLETACEPALQTMTKMQWANVDTVGDESRYVASIRQHLRQCVVRIRDCLGQARKYFMQFCFRFVNAFVPKFINAILRCRPVSVTGAEQLLLDTHALKTELVNLPVLESAAGRKPPEAFTKLVIKGMTKAEMILKLVMAPVDPDPGTFVEHYINFLPESDVVEFQKILDMKSVRKNEQTAIMDIFREKKAALDSKNDLNADRGGVASDAALSSGDNSSLDSRIRKLEKLKSMNQ